MKLALGNAEACGSLEELLERAATVTLHVDGRAGQLITERMTQYEASA